MNERLRNGLVLAVLVGVFAAIACRGIGGPFGEGHNGYNGAAFSQAARNSLRFGIVPQVQYHTGLEAPPPTDYYTHHPMMLHGHLVAVFAAVGVSAPAGRAVPVFYGIAGLLMLFVLVRRTNGVNTALIAVAIYVLTPVNLIFASMIDHEQACIFYCLLMLFFYLRWYDEGRARDMIGLFVATSIAAQWDWPTYYLAFFIFVHAALREVRLLRGGGGFRFRSAYVWLALFCVVVLANFAGFFFWVQSQRGDLGDMGHAFTDRFGFYGSYWYRLLQRELFLHGPLVIVLIGAMVAELGAAARQKRFTKGHLVALFFVGMQLIHTGVFGTAHFIHAYWIYFLSPAIAVGGALALQTMYRGLRRRLEANMSPGGVKAALALAVAAPLITQSAMAWAYYDDKFETGGDVARPDAPVSNIELIRWAPLLTERYPRGTVEFVLHPSMSASRIDFFFQLDSPYTVDFDLEPHPEGLPRVMLVDLEHVLAPNATLGQLNELSRAHPIWIVDERFVAIEESAVGSRPPERAHLRSEVRDTSLVERWLMSPYAPMVGFHEADERPEFAERFDDARRFTRTNLLGGHGGTMGHFECPDGDYVVGIDVVTTDTEAGATVIGDIRARCRKSVSRWSNDRFEEYGEDEFETLTCPDGHEIVGMAGARGRFIDALELMCRPTGGGMHEEIRAERRGGDGGREFVLRCPRLGVATGVRNRTGAVLDAFGLYCARPAED